MMIQQVRLSFKNEEYEEIKKLKLPGLALTKSIQMILLKIAKKTKEGEKQV